MDEDKIKEAADKLKGEAATAAKEAAETAVKEVKTTVDGIKSTVDEINESRKQMQEDIDGIALKMARNGVSYDGDGPEGKSFKEEYTAIVDKVKARKRGETIEVELSAKAAVTMLTPATVPGRLVSPTQGMYVGLPDTPTHVRELLAPGTMGGNLLVYPREVSVEGAPAMTGEGQKKPQMSFIYEEVTATVKKLPVFFKLSTELVADAPAFVSYMTARARESIKDVEDQQLLYGDGTGQNLTGIAPLAVAFNPAGAKVPRPNKIDVLRLAVAQVRRAKYKASAIMLNPDDCAEMELEKDLNGNYLLPTVFTGTMPQIGRVVIIEVDAILPDNFLVGAFNMGAQVYEREGLTIRIFDQNEDDAVKNLVTVILEERLLQAVYRPASFVKGTFTAAITAITPA